MARNKYELNQKELAEQNKDMWDKSHKSPSGLYGEDLAAYMIMAYLNGEY